MSLEHDGQIVMSGPIKATGSQNPPFVCSSSWMPTAVPDISPWIAGSWEGPEALEGGED